MTEDGYVRLTLRGPRVSDARAAGPGALLFVDVEPGAEEAGDLSTLRDIPHDVFREARWLVARANAAPAAGRPRRRRLRRATREPPSLFDALSRQVRDMELRCHAAVLHQPLGEAAWIEHDGELPEADLIDRARTAELLALLDWGQAVWTPTDYHYRLPSGEHAASFVRVANAIREPRDATVLASWLHPHLHDGAGLVMDNGTLTAVAQAVIAAMRTWGREPGPIAILDNYPTTDWDVSRAVRQARRSNAAVAVLSVNSSGSMLDRLVRAMSTEGAGAEVAIHVLVDKHPVTETTTRRGPVAVHVWCPRPGRAPVVARGTDDGESCALCVNQTTTTVVPISPDTFDATLKAAVRTITPSISDPTANRTLWELCERHDGIAIEQKPPDDLAPYRPPGPMALRIDFTKMLSSAPFRRGTVRALQQSLARVGRKDLPGELASELLLVPERELERPGMRELIAELEPVIGRPQAIEPFPIDARWGGELRAAVQTAKTLGVLTLGVVTGHTLYQALAESQALREPGELLTGIVLHPRMPEQRAWQTLENAYAGRLFYAWHSFLPLRSPIAEEAHALTVFAGGERAAALSDEGKRFLELRRRFCQDVALDDQGLFWGSTPDSRLTPNSLFGQGLRGPAVYAAVASAMERSRKQTLARAEPERRVFELDAIARSYYDPMILAATMRWLEPHEAWWGWTPDESRSIVNQMLVRLREEDQLLLLTSELLLAAAQGKLPRPAMGELRAVAKPFAASLTPERRAPLELGLAMTPEYLTHDQQRAEERWKQQLADR